jgi:hypothetical protein
MPDKPLRRRDAFFGLHFDLHPKATDTELGADTTEENIRALLERVGPDFVQYDCKGHAGYTGYPTEVGWSSPGIVNDALGVWRKVTREHGVALLIHYSGVQDYIAVAEHPEWAAVHADGTPDEKATSTFGPYVDELMIPQLREVIGMHDLDGVWVDGDCWGTLPDWSEAALAKWRDETGEADAPADADDPRWVRWMDFHRRQFEAYLRHWVDALHEFKPDLDITSNWMYSTYAPKPVEADLDYLSGDYSPSDSCDRARIEARYLASTGMPWDLMAWGFNRVGSGPWSHKNALQLQQEAAVVLMQGGGFQVYNQPTRSGHIVETVIETCGQVADFCRARQEVCFRSETVPQVAVVLPSVEMTERSTRVWHTGGTRAELEGTLHAMLELGYSVDLLAEHQLSGRLADFPLVVLPDCSRLADGFAEELVEYVRAGGSLLLIGPHAAEMFAAHLRVKFPDAAVSRSEAAAGSVGWDGSWQAGASTDAADEVPAHVRSSFGAGMCNGLWRRVELDGAEAVGYRWPTFDTRGEGEIASTVAPLGDGLIGAVYGPLATHYLSEHRPALRHFIGDLAARLFAEPAAQTDAPSCVDIALRRTTDSRLSLHLLNLAEAQRARSFQSPDFIPTLGPIQVRMLVSEEPSSVTWEPSGDALEWQWANGVLEATIPALHIHGALVVT